MHDRIAKAAESAGRSAFGVAVLPVTKGQPFEAVRAALSIGLTTFGENYVQECSAKQAALGDVRVEWRMLGHLQRNKAKDATRLFRMVESLDSSRLARALAAAAPPDQPMPVLMEVDFTGIAGRSGVPEEDAEQVARTIVGLPELQLRGLMTVASLEAPAECFRACRRLRDRLETRLGIELPELSMGMSGDFEVAVAEGSREVRLGTVLFGPRGGGLSAASGG